MELPAGHKRFVIEGFADGSARYYLNPISFNTRAMAEDFVARYAHVRYVVETAQGLSHARNRGWREARGQSAMARQSSIRGLSTGRPRLRAAQCESGSIMPRG